jgi:hypothetical protein
LSKPGNQNLLVTIVLAFLVLGDPPARKEPPTQKDLAAITDRGRDLAGYDAAAWHASDALQPKQPKEGSAVRYIAHKIDKKWYVAFGRLDEKGEKFLIAYEATQAVKPDAFDVKEITPPIEDRGSSYRRRERSTHPLRTSWNISRGSSVPTTSLFSPQRRGRSGCARTPVEVGRLELLKSKSELFAAGKLAAWQGSTLPWRRRCESRGCGGYGYGATGWR